MGSVSQATATQLPNEKLPTDTTENCNRTKGRLGDMVHVLVKFHFFNYVSYSHTKQKQLCNIEGKTDSSFLILPSIVICKYLGITNPPRLNVTNATNT